MDCQPNRTDRIRTQFGWTLIEQLMVLAIVAVLATVAMPSMCRMLARGRLQSAQMDLIASLHQARYAAVSLGLPAVFCPSTDGRTCARSTHWEDGWLLAVDRDGNNQPDHAPLQTGPAARKGMHLRSSIGRYRVRFHPDGSAAGSNLTITLCLPGRHAEALNVVVSNAGRVRGEVASENQSSRCAATG